MPAKHDIDPQTVQNAAELLFANLGLLDDLSPDLSNTVANIYYRAFWYRSHATLPTTLSQYRLFMEEAGRSLAAFEYIDETVRTIRQTRSQSPDIAGLMASCLVDHNNYRIRNAIDKSAIRRAIERWFSTAHDIPGLYRLFRQAGFAASR